MDSKKQPAYTASAPTVQTTTGNVMGFQNEQTAQSCFFGIPYAEPPVGDLRFMPTVPKKPWDGVLDATAFSPASPQIFEPTEGSYEEFTGEKDPPPGRAWLGAEDSLTVNVWTPAADSAKRPVLVWIHGGANWLESSRLATYQGDEFVARGDVVFVSLNYRLGIFGWLDMSVIGGDDYKESYANGLRDQVTALQWIRANIAAFGGDPENITVMGESAGSIDISWLLANGHLDGIARRVVMMSGVAGLIGLSGDLTRGFTPEYGQELAADFLKRAGLTSMEQVRALSTADIMERVVRVAKESDILFQMDSLFWSRVSSFTPHDPFRAAQQGLKSDIDVVVGYTAYEMGLWLFWDDKLDTHPVAWSAEKIIGFDPAAQKSAAQLYDKLYADDREGARGMHLVGDAIFVMPTYWFADALAAHGTNVWVYQFDWEANERQRALHAADQAFLFHKLDTPAAGHLMGAAKDQAEAQAREHLSALMMDSILAYAHTGKPGGGGIDWPQYSAEKRTVYGFDVTPTLHDDPAGPRREWWYAHYYRPALAEK